MAHPCAREPQWSSSARRRSQPGGPRVSRSKVEPSVCCVEKANRRGDEERSGRRVLASNLPGTSGPSQSQRSCSAQSQTSSCQTEEASVSVIEDGNARANISIWCWRFALDSSNLISCLVEDGASRRVDSRSAPVRCTNKKVLQVRRMRAPSKCQKRLRGMIGAYSNASVHRGDNTLGGPLTSHTLYFPLAKSSVNDVSAES